MTFGVLRWCLGLLWWCFVSAKWFLKLELIWKLVSTRFAMTFCQSSLQTQTSSQTESNSDHWTRSWTWQRRRRRWRRHRRPSPRRPSGRGRRGWRERRGCPPCASGQKPAAAWIEFGYFLALILELRKYLRVILKLKLILPLRIKGWVRETRIDGWMRPVAGVMQLVDKISPWWLETNLVYYLVKVVKDYIYTMIYI